ncbi:hypothetical protein LT337_09040 [Mycolicibacterium fortuitum]|nr:hypothetical protein LT337_09040 [Mycolicibacterium fortuitum]
MTKPTTTPPSSETEILTECTELLSSRLPDAWRVDVQRSPADAGIDAVLALTAPSGEQVRFVVEAKRLLVGRDIPRVSEQLQWAADRELSNTKTMVMSRYLAPQSANDYWKATCRLSTPPATSWSSRRVLLCTFATGAPTKIPGEARAGHADHWRVSPQLV